MLILVSLIVISVFTITDVYTIIMGILSSSEKNELEIPFEYKVIDTDMSGDCKMLGDIDGDGYQDIMVAGYQMYCYIYPNWTKTLIANCNTEFTTDADLGDIDGDNDLDVVIPDGKGLNNLLWFENSLSEEDPTFHSWNVHVIGSIGDWGKDIELDDYDGDNRLDVATRSQTDAYIFFQNGSDTWDRVHIYNIGGGEGMGSGDVDSDGDRDLVLNGYWLENPRPGGNPSEDTWLKHDIDSMYKTIKALVVDINDDGKNEIFFSNSEGDGEVRWYEATDPKNGPWIRHDIDNLNKCHTLQAADMDLDGDLDIIVSEMFENVIVFLNKGNGLSWYKQVLGPRGIHNGVVGDIGNDGDIDVVGAMYIGHSPVNMWENKLNNRRITISNFVNDFSSNSEVKIIYPSNSVNKPLNRGVASVSDWGASAFVSTKLENFTEGLDTNGDFVNQQLGKPIGGPYISIISFGGPMVNVPVYYYEVNKIAPVLYCGVPGAVGKDEPWSQWYLANGSAITETALRIDKQNDLFLIETFQDSEGRYIFITYGIGWKGTYAGGKYFDKRIFPNLAEYPYEWIIVKWEDTNKDEFVNAPDDGDTYIFLAAGS